MTAPDAVRAHQALAAEALQAAMRGDRASIREALYLLATEQSPTAVVRAVLSCVDTMQARCDLGAGQAGQPVAVLIRDLGRPAVHARGETTVRDAAARLIGLRLADDEPGFAAALQAIPEDNVGGVLSTAVEMCGFTIADHEGVLPADLGEPRARHDACPGGCGTRIRGQVVVACARCWRLCPAPLRFAFTVSAAGTRRHFDAWVAARRWFREIHRQGRPL